MRTVKLVGGVMVLLLWSVVGFSQQLRLGKNSVTLQKSAILELESDNQGLLFPRIIDTTLINTLTPPDGMVIFHQPSRQLMVRGNGHWNALAASSSLALSNLLDVTISAPANGQLLQFNGTKWMNMTPAFLTSIDTTNTSNFHIKVKSLFSAGTGLTYNSTTGVFNNTGVLSLNGNTGALTMDTSYINNFYLKVRSLTTNTAPITLSNGVIGITQATTSTNGYLSSTDWNTFNNKAGSFSRGDFTETGSNILTIAGGTNAVIGSGTSILVKQAATAQSGFLSSIDWNTFNNKLSTVDTTNIASFHLKVKSLFSAGTGINYNNTTGVISNAGVTSLNGNTGVLTMDTGYISNFYSKVRSLSTAAAPITLANGQIGITQASASTNGYLSSSDWNTFNNKASSYTSGNLTESGSNILTIAGGTNAVLGSGTSILVKQAATAQNGFLSSTDWNTFNNKLSTIDTTNIANFHLKVKSLFNAGTGITYNNTTGLISNAGVTSVNGNTGVLTLDTNYISNFFTKVRSLTTATAPITLTNGNIGITQATTSSNGYLSSVDWNTFNNKAGSFTRGNLTETGSGILTITGGTNAVLGSGTSILVKQAATAQDGFLSNVDWNTFNNKLSTIDTANIPQFWKKTRSLLSAGTGIAYNNLTGIISNSGVTSLNGNTGALTMDTGYISNFYLKTRGLLSAGTGISYNATTGVISSSSGASINSLNGLTTATQTFATGNSGTDFNISSATSTHTFNLPDASATARGVITTAAQVLAGVKTFSSAPIISTLTTGSIPFIGTSKELAEDNSKLFWDNTNKRLGVNTNTPGSDFTLFQGAGGAGPTKGFRFTGNSIGGTNTGTGFNLSLGFNVTNNKQLWLGDADYLGNSAGTFVRYSASNGSTILDAIDGVNGSRRPLSLGVGGDPNAALIFGSDGSSTAPSSYIWGNGNMAIGNGFRSSAAPINGLIIQGNTGIGSATFDGTNAEKLLVDAGTTTSENAIVAKGTIDSYFQINIQNKSTGVSASSDVVATADNGSETTNFIDMGINGSAYSSGVMGGINDAYLYNLGQNMLIGTGTAAKSLIFMTGGTAQGTNERMRIDGNGVVGINTLTGNASTKLDVNGAVKLGAKGTVEKNIISFEYVNPSNINVSSGGVNGLLSTFSAGSLDATITIPAANTPTTTRGTVNVSVDQDLPTNVSIAWARIATTSTVKIRFLNSGTGAQTIPANLKLYITITEF